MIRSLTLYYDDLLYKVSQLIIFACMDAYTVIEVLNNGTTKPQVESETDILLIQDGDVSVGRICYDSDDYSELYIDSPVNEIVLNKEAYKLVKEKFPEYLKTPSSVILICPEDLSAKMEW